MGDITIIQEEEDLDMDIVRVGCGLSAKNQRNFLKPSLIQHARTRGVSLHVLDPSRPIADQGIFHIILHKLSGDDSWVQNLAIFSSHHPDVIIVDPPPATKRLRNRVSMLQAVSEIQLIPPCPQTFGIPKHKVLLSHHPETGAASDKKEEELQFPILAKPLVASGTHESHSLSLVFNAVSLAKLATPVLLQEFVNHGGVVFKVYVVGDYVRCERRPSLPDVDQDRATLLQAGSDEPLGFFRISNMTEGEPSLPVNVAEAELPPAAFLSGLARGLRQALGLHLFNFDLIREKRAQNHYDIIDINYFPGYAKLPGYESVFVDFFLALAKSKTKTPTPTSTQTPTPIPTPDNHHDDKLI